MIGRACATPSHPVVSGLRLFDAPSIRSLVEGFLLVQTNPVKRPGEAATSRDLAHRVGVDVKYLTSSILPNPYQALRDRELGTTEVSSISGYQYSDDMPEVLDRQTAIYALTKHFGPLLYAVRLSDGTIKIGRSGNLRKRFNELWHARRVRVVEFLAYRVGSLADERETHRMLADHVAYGREFYHPTAEVMAVVDSWRRDLGIEAA